MIAVFATNAIFTVAARYIYYMCKSTFRPVCTFMQIQGILFIQLQGNDIVVNFQGNIFIQRT